MSASGSDGHSPRKRTDIHETHRPSPPRKQPSCHQRRRLHGLPDSVKLSGSGSPRNQKAEQVFADWTDGPLAHLPSGSFPANGAWLACAAISHNLLRAAGSLAGLACARGQRGHAAPRSHRCRRPYRPPRPRRDHPVPARRMAPRTGLDEPVRSRLRTARHRGLTSPEPVTTSQWSCRCPEWQTHATARGRARSSR
jgi:hypothetical protein